MISMKRPENTHQGVVGELDPPPPKGDSDVSQCSFTVVTCKPSQTLKDYSVKRTIKCKIIKIK